MHTYGRPPLTATGIGTRLAAARDRVRALVEAAGARAEARQELLALRADVERLRADRGALLRRLGEAVYEGDPAGTESGRAKVRAVDERIAAREAEMRQVAERTQERVERVRAEARPTELLEPPEPAPPEPYPPSIPEPYPPPDEGTPPTPAPVPEPYPPPDEGDPPRLP